MKVMEISVHKFEEFMRLQKLESDLVSRLSFYLDQQKLNLKRMEEINKIAQQLSDMRHGNLQWFKKAHKAVKAICHNGFSFAKYTDKGIKKLQELMTEENDE